MKTTIITSERWKKKLKKYTKAKFVTKIFELKEGDILISFSFGKVIPIKKLKKFRHKYNFHGGPPQNPGKDPHHWAIYYKQKYFGVTLHKMNKKVDDGKILNFIRFKIKQDWTPQILRNYAEKKMLILFKKNINNIISGKINATNKNYKWKKYKKRKRSDILKLIKSNPNLRKQKFFLKSFSDFF